MWGRARCLPRRTQEITMNPLRIRRTFLALPVIVVGVWILFFPVHWACERLGADLREEPVVLSSIIWMSLLTWYVFFSGRFVDSALRPRALLIFGSLSLAILIGAAIWTRQPA